MLQKALTANELTKLTIERMTLEGSVVWRQNNYATRGRKFIGMRGLPDICGYDKWGTAIYCEVKAKGDTLSEDQINFMVNANSNKCKCYIAHEVKGEPVLSTWKEYESN